MKRRIRNQILILFIDLLTTLIAGVFSVLLIDGVSDFHFDSIFLYFYTIIPVVFILQEIFLYLFRLGQIAWRYAGFRDILKIGISTVLSTMITYGLFSAVELRVGDCTFNNPVLSVYLVFLVLTFVMFLLIRIFIREWGIHREAVRCETPERQNPRESFGNVMVIGCGSASMSVISMLKNPANFKNTSVRCLIDDDPEKLHRMYRGVQVVGGREAILESAEKYQIDTILFGISSCTGEVRQEFFDIFAKTPCALKTIPTISKLISGEEKLSNIKNFEIEDLLERETIQITFDESKDYLHDNAVLVTGGGGSIGSELCRQIVKHNPSILIIFDVYENNAYDIQNELKHNYPDVNIVTLIGSVRDQQRLDYVFKTYHPSIVFHAAAHKHVPLMEDSPHESIKNNVFGTHNTAHAADKYGAKRFVLISTDKAVNPTNIMGASKRICEMIVQYFSRHSKTEFVAVRFGNVLGSNGSVIPLFKRQIEQGGPITVTHPDIIRYFMTIPEAVSLVLEAGADAKGGEIFVLDMGKPVKIVKLAENMIRLSGYIPYQTMNIVFTGLRPGEKLYEELLMDEEGMKETSNKLIYIGHPIKFEDEQFKNDLAWLKELAYDETSDIRSAVSKMVPTYHYTGASKNN